jgi:AraC-like DNA-binding protein
MTPAAKALREALISSPTSVRFAAPSAPLQGLVSTFYFATVPPRPEPVEDLLHPEWANVRLTLDGGWDASVGPGEPAPVPRALLTGPTSMASLIRSRGADSVGIGLLPLGWARLVGGDASAFADRIVPLDGLLGPEVGGLVDRLAGIDEAERTRRLDAALVARLGAVPPVDEAPILRTHKALIDPATRSVEGLAAAVGLSDRQLVRLCRRHFGFPPKLLLRRQRFLRSFARLREAPDAVWRELIDDAYVDQAHFNHDFQRFMGMSPTAYFARRRAILEQAARLREAMFGRALQGLHEPVRPTADRRMA